MKKKIQWKAKMYIAAPLKEVWEYIKNLANIPLFHPRVDNVEFISGKTTREEGVTYKCNITKGSQKGWCIEETVEVIENQKITTKIPNDSWGISSLFKHFETEVYFTRVNECSTIVELITYYKTVSIKSKLINLIGKQKMKRQALDMLKTMKRLIEDQYQKFKIQSSIHLD